MLCKGGRYPESLITALSFLLPHFYKRQELKLIGVGFLFLVCFRHTLRKEDCTMHLQKVFRMHVLALLGDRNVLLLDSRQLPVQRWAQ